jgi:polyisoprenyl-teichoic acid--peptidoglycan teichoic acid transferase
MNQKRLITVSVIILAVSLLAILPASVHYIYGLYRNFARIPAVFAAAVSDFSFLPEPEGSADPVTFLMFGIDAGEWVGGSYRPGPGRADTIVLIKAFPAAGSAALLSIPRDTLVEIPGYPGDDKINHAYAFGRADLLAASVENFTGIPVDYYIGLNYRVFKEIVDYLGGVEFYVDRVIVSRGKNLEPGLQVLDGDEAFSVVSTRADPMGDIDRVRRQQRFIKAVWAESKGRAYDDLFYLMLAVWNNIDTNMSFMEAAMLSRNLGGIKEENAAMELVPGTFYNRGGISYWRPYLAQTEELIRVLFDEPGISEEGGAENDG